MKTLEELRQEHAHAFHHLQICKCLLLNADIAINENDSSIYSLKELIEIYDEYDKNYIRAQRNFDIAEELYEKEKLAIDLINSHKYTL